MAKIRLLIAEDEDLIRTGIEKYIRAKSKLIDEVLVARDGQEALEIIYRLKPQIMLLDIHMPRKDGLTVLKEAVSAGVCPTALILSGHDEFQYAQNAIRYGVVDYLLKPCRNTEILQKIDKIAEKMLKSGNNEDVHGLFTNEAMGLRTGDQLNLENQPHELVVSALEYISEHYNEEVTLTSVAGVIGINASYLSTLFTSTLGKSFVESLNQIRISRACDFFEDNQLKSYEVSHLVGFKDEKYFSNVFNKVMGMTPSEYRKMKGAKRNEK